MNYKFFIGLALIPTMSYATITFLGLNEDSSITKNSFSCPESLGAEGIAVCQNRSTQANNFKFNSPKTLQIFNNQQYWAQQKYKEQQLLMARGYKDNDLDSTMANRGWSITGGFLIMITTDPLVTEQIEQKKVAKKGQVKVVAQLWYNGGSLIQLWAQDVAVLTDGQSFSISVSSTDSAISQEASVIKKLNQPKNLQAVKEQFLQEVQLSPRNIVEADYKVAKGSPKNITIVPA
jgi:hypothetical protein